MVDINGKLEVNETYNNFITRVINTLLNGKLLRNLVKQDVTIKDIEKNLFNQNKVLAIQLGDFFNLNGYIDLCYSEENGTYLQFSYYKPTSDGLYEVNESDDIVTSLYAKTIITTMYNEIDNDLNKYIATFNRKMKSHFKLETLQLVDEDNDYLGYYDVRIHFEKKFAEDDIDVFESFLNNLTPVLFLNWQLPKLIEQISTPKFYKEYQ